MPKVFPCYSQSDRDLAHELAAFLERGVGVEVLLEEGEMQPGEDLIAKVQDGLAADVVLMLFSPDAVPGRWILERWKSVFWDQAAEVNTSLATLLCRDCRFPDLLRRRNFFDLRAHRLPAFRAIKRWLLSLWPMARKGPFTPAKQPSFSGRETELETLCTLLADAPGVAALSNAAPGSGKTALALEFAYRHQDDFDAVYWLTCGSRSPAGLAGDLATQMNLRLDGDLEVCLNELRQACARQRSLLVLDDAAIDTAAILSSRGRNSVLVTTRDEELAGALSATALHLDPFAGPDTAAWKEAVRKLDPAEHRLFAAACACTASGFPIEVAARAADSEDEEVRDIVPWFLSAGLFAPFDQNGLRYLVPAGAREAMAASGETETWARHHAATVCDLFDAQPAATLDLTAYWPDLQCALAWALGSRDGHWELACKLARRAVAWARTQDRLAEAFEILQDWSRAARRLRDRRILEDCAWEQIWIFERWGRDEEAAALDEVRRKKYAAQMSFNF